MKCFSVRNSLRKKSSAQRPLSGKNICLTVGRSQKISLIAGRVEKVSVEHDYFSYFCCVMATITEFYRKNK